jgi:hypothetical protein
MPLEHPLIDSIEACWREHAEYARRLIADLEDEEMVSQPVPGVTMNHPAWILSHLSIYAPVIAACFRDDPFEDPADHRFGRASKPEPTTTPYLPKGELLRAFVGGYDDALAAFRAMPAERLTAATPLERWLERFPTIGHLPIQFFVKHIGLHLGQVSAWRRAGGRAPV